MPISEDELDHKGSSQHHQGYHPHQHMQLPHQQVSGMSKAEQRRSNKPIMEKRRRARINHCLNELKTLILDAMKKDPARHSKLEKADILEMTVKHLQNVQRQQLAVAVATDPTVLHKFRTGFNECAGEVSRYIGRIEGVDPTVRSRLLAHLASCVSGLHQLTPFSFGAMAAAATPPPPQMPFPHIPAPVSSTSTMPSPADDGSGVLPGTPRSSLSAGIPQVPPFPSGDVNNNQSQQQSAATRLMAGLQLIPSRLPTGELALLLPGSGRLSDGESGTSFSSVISPATSTTVSTSASIHNRPSPSSSGSPPGHTHHSAFTAVTRTTSPPPPTVVPGPPSPASSTSSSCASTSCDSTSFPNPSPATGPQQLQPPEAPKFSFRFPCPSIPPMSFGSEVRTFPFPPSALLQGPRMNVLAAPALFTETGPHPTPAAKVDRETEGQAKTAPERGVTSTAVESIQTKNAEHSMPELGSPAPPLLYAVCSTSSSSATGISSSSSVLLPDATLSCPPAPPALFLSSPASVPRDALDFSVKKEQSGEDAANDKMSRLSLGFGVKRPAADEFVYKNEGEVSPAAKIARLEVKVEPTSLDRDEDGNGVKISEGCLSVEVISTPSSSTIPNAENPSSEEGAGLDMWRPW